MSAPIRILIVDDHEIVRKGISAVLSTKPDIEVAGQAQDGAEAIGMADRLQPDVILMDLLMPRVDGVEAIRQIPVSSLQPRILVLTTFAADDQILPALKAGAVGCLLKDAGPQALVPMIRQVHQGVFSLHPSTARKVLDEFRQRMQPSPTADPALQREVAVLQCMAQGLSHAETAQTLLVSETAVHDVMRSILSRLHAASRMQTVL